MAPHIPTEEAKRRLLPGFDVYKYTHLLYLTDLNRDFGVVRLNLEAMKAFSDTVVITQRHVISAEQAVVKNWLDAGRFEKNVPYPWGAATMASMEFANYEYLKIASAFELHLKVRLLARNFLLHAIDPKVVGCKSLALEQRDRPIDRDEFKAVQAYHFDGRQNYLPGLKDASVKFSWLTDKAAYRSALGLTDQELDIAKDYRVLRNQIHLPGDVVEAPSIQGLQRPIAEFLTEFINDRIVDWSNGLIAIYKMKLRPFSRLS